jgi:hypothetical protein
MHACIYDMICVRVTKLVEQSLHLGRDTSTVQECATHSERALFEATTTIPVMSSKSSLKKLRREGLGVCFIRPSLPTGSTDFCCWISICQSLSNIIHMITGRNQSDSIISTRIVILCDRCHRLCITCMYVSFSSYTYLHGDGSLCQLIGAYIWHVVSLSLSLSLSLCVCVCVYVCDIDLYTTVYDMDLTTYGLLYIPVIAASTWFLTTAYKNVTITTHALYVMSSSCSCSCSCITRSCTSQLFGLGY